MEHEILTHPLTAEQVRAELNFIVEYFRDAGMRDCEIMFGFAWGNDYYPGNEWFYEEVELSSLERKVGQVESAGFGLMGQNDLFVRIAGTEFHFCNDSDVHIRFENSTEHVEFIYERWKKIGYKPAEWIKNQENGPGERVRFS